MSTASITLAARTAEFEAKLNHAVGTFQKLSAKGVATSKALDTSFKTITRVSKDSVRDIEKSFNSLSIKSDFSLEVQTKALQRNAKFFKAQYYKIKMDGESSAADITRAYQAMHVKLRQLSQQPIGLTQVDVDHAAALARNKEFNDKRIADNKRVYWARIKAEKANLLAYEASENEAYLINQKFNEAKALASKQSAQRRIRDLNQIIKYERKVATDKKALLAKEVKDARAAYDKISNYRIKAQMQRITGGQLAGPEFGSRLKAQMQAAVPSVEKIDKRTGQIAGNVKKAGKHMNVFNLASVASILKIQIMFTLVNNIMSVVARMPGTAMEAVESFDAAAISSAAMITSMQKGVTDIGEAYQSNKRYAEAVNEVLIKMDAKTAASGKNLTDMNKKFALQGILLDVNNEKQKQGFLNIANALATMTSGDVNAAMQYPQEISALLRAENRTTNKLFQQLNNMVGGDLKKRLAQWKKEGTTIVEVGKLLKGYGEATKDIEGLWETQRSTMVTIRDEILRKGFRREYELIIEKMKEMNEWASNNKEMLAGMLDGTFKTLNAIISVLPEIALAIGVVTIAQLKWNTAAKANPYFMTAGAIMLINKGLKDLAGTKIPFIGELGDFSLGGVGKSFIKAKDDLNKFIDSVKGVVGIEKKVQLDLWSKSDAKKYITLPKGVSSAMVDKEAIRAAEKLKNTIIEVRKSEVDITLAYTEGMSKLELVSLENKYKAMLISDKAYLDKKHELLIAAANRDVVVKQKILDQAQLAFTLIPPDKTLEEAEATLKVNKAKADLIKTKDTLLALTVKSAGESNDLLKKQVDLQNAATMSEIKNKLRLVDVNEKLFKITSGAAAVSRIKLLKDRLGLQAKELSANQRLTDAEKVRYQEQLIAIELTNEKIAEQNKILSDQTILSGMISAMDEYQRAAADTAGMMKTTFTSAFSQMEDALVTFMKTGKLSFSSLADSIISDLVRIQARKITSTLAQGLASAAGALFAPTLSSLPATPAGFGTTPTPTWNLPGRAAGGPVIAGQTYIINENRNTEGPEYFTPGSSGVITPASKMGGGEITIRLIDRDDNEIPTTQNTNQGGGVQIDAMLDRAAAAGVTNFGETFKAIQNMFGLTPALGRH